MEPVVVDVVIANDIVIELCGASNHSLFLLLLLLLLWV